MRTSRWLLVLFASAAAVCTAVLSASADDSSGGSGGGGAVPSRKQYDKRLPPVLPGEEVVTESGQKMKVWSSAGPVPVNQPTPLGYGVPGYGAGWPPVIIDDRFRDRGAPGQPGVPLQPGVPGEARAPGFRR